MPASPIYAYLRYKLAARTKRTLQDWEQGLRKPAGAAITLLRVAEQHPKALKNLAA